MEFYGDFLTTLHKALREIDKNYLDYDALVIGGSHQPRDIEKILEKIKEATKTKRPLLGICWGHQLCAIQWARENGIPDATSEEWGEGTLVVKKRIKLKVGLHEGESYWNNYEVAIDWEKPKHLFTTQFHPEYQSSIDRPHPLLTEFLIYAKNHKI